MIVQSSTQFFERSDITSKPGRTSKTSASTLKCDIDSLIIKLKETVIYSHKLDFRKCEKMNESRLINMVDSFQDLHFIRCILPNNDKQNAKFEEELVLRQLITSNTISYAKFIRFGYSKRVSCQKIIDECKWVKNKSCASRLNVCSKVLLSIGFKLRDFKMGNDGIAFRSDKFCMLETFFSDVVAARSFKEKEVKNTESLTNSSDPKQKFQPK